MESERYAKALVGLLEAARDAPGRGAVLEAALSSLADVDPDIGRICAQVLVGAGDRSAAESGSVLLAKLAAAEPSRAIDPDRFVDPNADRVDLMVVTVKPDELQAVMRVFSVEYSSGRELLPSTGLVGWRATWESFSVLIVMAGLAGNTHLAGLTAILRLTQRPKLAVLVGMAAGNPAKVRIGDVVVGEHVMEYEFKRMTNRGPFYSPRTYTPAIDFLTNAELVPQLSTDWTDRCRDAAGSVEPTVSHGQPSRKTLGRWSPSVHLGVILAGATLLENGDWPKLRREHHDRVRALEMEGAGFAHAMSASAHQPWLVVRGISDAGESGRDQSWQYCATVAAAMWLHDWILVGPGKAVLAGDPS